MRQPLFLFPKNISRPTYNSLFFSVIILILLKETFSHFGSHPKNLYEMVHKGTEILIGSLPYFHPFIIHYLSDAKERFKDITTITLAEAKGFHASLSLSLVMMIT